MDPIVLAALRLPLEEFVSLHAGLYLVMSEASESSWSGREATLLMRTRGQSSIGDVAQMRATAVPEPSGIVVTIGRAEDAHLAVTHSSVSGYHAELRAAEGGGYELRDCASTNGTRINGLALAAEVWTPLPLGAVLHLGSVSTVLLDAATLHEMLH